MKLDHFVWYPVPGKGYQDRPIAYSGDTNPALYTGLFKHEFVPLIVRYSKENFRGYMLFNYPNNSQILFTSISTKKAADEYGRTGVFHHSVIIDREALSSGLISLLEVEKAMREYENNNPFPKGTIEPIEVQENYPPSFSYAKKLRTFVSKAAVETLATRMMTPGENRTILRCLGSTPMDRLKIGVYIVELLDFVCGIHGISFATEPPVSADYYPLFNLLVLERAYPPEKDASSWAVLKWDILNPTLPRIKGKEEVYKKIEMSF